MRILTWVMSKLVHVQPSRSQDQNVESLSQNAIESQNQDVMAAAERAMLESAGESQNDLAKALDEVAKANEQKNVVRGFVEMKSSSSLYQTIP